MSVENRSKTIEYNAAGGLLLTLFRSDLNRFLKELYISGFDSVCLLPFRALIDWKPFYGLPESRVQIAHFEDAWNPTHEDDPLSAALAAFFHKKSVTDVLLRRREPHPTMYWDALFPSESTSARIFKRIQTTFRDAKFISHHPHVPMDPHQWLLEIHPGLDMDAQKVLDWSYKTNVRLVFDPSHLLDSFTSTSLPGLPTTPKNDWERQFMFFRKRLEVVDIKGDLQEFRFEASEDGEGKMKGYLAELASAAKQTDNVNTLRVEIRIPTTQQIPLLRKSQQKGFEFLAQIAANLRSIH